VTRGSPSSSRPATTRGTGPTVGGPEARQHIDELSKRYVGTEYSRPIGPAGRVIFKIAPDKVNTAKG
jgi:hypothetical protein